MMKVTCILLAMAAAAMASSEEDDSSFTEDSTKLLIMLISLLLALFPDEFGYGPVGLSRPPVYPIERRRRKVNCSEKSVKQKYSSILS